MNINLSHITRRYQLNQHQMVFNTLLGQGQKKSGVGQMDMFIRSSGTINDAGLYSPAMEKDKYISNTLLLLINNNVSNVKQHGDIYECAGVRFTADQIPKIDTSTLPEIKAHNNIIDFGKNQYFKYVSSDGKEHALFTNDKGVGFVHSESMRGAEYDPVGNRYARFWRYMMSDDPVYYGLTFSDDEVRDMMSDVGIEEGFFTVKMGDREMTHYYSGSKTEGVIHSKERYDSKYKHLTSTGRELMNYEPGDVFTLNGKEYVLSENHTLDIPYGEDLWALEDPANYKFGEKIE